MNRAWRIAAKELLQTRRDRLAAVFTIVLPIVFTIFLGVIIGGMGGDNSIPVAVVDEDLTLASQQFLDRLEASPLLTLKTMTADKIDTAVEDQSVAAALVIPEGFGTALDSSRPSALQLVRLETSSGAQSVVQAVQTAVSELNSTLLAAKVAVERVSSATGASSGADMAASARVAGAGRPCFPGSVGPNVDANSGAGDDRLRGPAGRRLRHRVHRVARPMGALQPSDGGDRRGLGAPVGPPATAGIQRGVGRGHHRG